MVMTPADIVPITKDGNLVSPYDREIFEWIPGGRFIATMCVHDAAKPCRHENVILLKDVDSGTLYRIFNLDYVKMMIACKNVSHSVVHGLWEFVHCGQSYGIRLLRQLK